jgi:hypothetical protein
MPTTKQFTSGPMPNGTSTNNNDGGQQIVPHHLAHVSDASASKDTKLALCSKLVFVNRATKASMIPHWWTFSTTTSCSLVVRLSCYEPFYDIWQHSCQLNNIRPKNVQQKRYNALHNVDHIV